MSKWSAKFPTPKAKQTKWWFYGWPWGKMDPNTLVEELPSLIIVDCTKAGGTYNYIADGNFFYESEAVGVFVKFNGPELPTVDEVMALVKNPEK
jgi:hypothetical protein